MIDLVNGRLCKVTQTIDHAYECPMSGQPPRYPVPAIRHDAYWFSECGATVFMIWELKDLDDPCLDELVKVWGSLD